VEGRGELRELLEALLPVLVAVGIKELLAKGLLVKHFVNNYSIEEGCKGDTHGSGV